MRKKHKILAVLTAVATILVQLHLSSFAAGAESGAKLIFGDTTEPTAFYHNVNNSLRTVNGGAVLVVADDPGLASSQNEQKVLFCL